MARTAEDYGVPDLSDAVLQELASNPRKYGEKSKYAQRELASRSDMQRQTDVYRKALEKATYAQLGPEFSGGLNRITGYLAGAGPLADSGARTALSSQLYSQILQRAQGQIGGGTSDLIGSLIKQRQNYRYQSQLMSQQAKANKKKWYDYAAGIAGAGAGAAASSAGGGGGGGGGGAAGYQTTDAYFA